MPRPSPVVDVRRETLAAAHRCWRQGDFTRATAYAQMAFDWFPNDPATWKCLTLILLAQGRWANAQLSLTQAVALNPADTGLRLWAQALSSMDGERWAQSDQWLPALADAMLVEAHPEDAEAVSWVATRLGIRAPWVEVCRAKAWGRLKRASEATALLRTALNSDSPSPLHWAALAQLELDAHDTGKALAVLKEGVARFPDDLPLKELFVNALLSAGDVEAAAALVCAGRGADTPEAPEWLIQRGVVRMRQRQFSEAQRLFRQAVGMWLEAEPPALVRTSVSTAFDQAWILDALWSTLRSLHDEGIQAFPTSGTLLGLTRSGRLLPFDKDWDLGVPWAQMSAAIDCLSRHGWVEHACSFGLVNPRAFRHTGSCLVLDLSGLLPEPDSERMLGGFWMSFPPSTDDRVTVFPPLDLQRVARAGGHVWMLAHADAWLEALYGNWRVPDPDFDTVIAAHNLRDFSALTQCYAWLRIATRWRQGQIGKLMSLLTHTRRHLPDDEVLARLERRIQPLLR